MLRRRQINNEGITKRNKKNELTMNDGSSVCLLRKMDLGILVIVVLCLLVLLLGIKEPYSPFTYGLLTHIQGVFQEKDVVRKKETSNNEKCSVFLAPSSLPNGGMGMFTTQNISKGEIILPTDGPQIPIIDPDYESQRSSDAWVSLFSKYWWGEGRTDPSVYEADYAFEYQITCGALPNSHVLLDNLETGHPAVVPYDDSMTDRMTNPGTGAISPYMGRDSIAARDIHAGDELFLAYPDEYMNAISEKYGIPKKKNYHEAGVIIYYLLQRYDGITDYDVWKKDEMYRSVMDSNMQELLPKSQNDVDRVLASVKDTLRPDDIAHTIAKEIYVQKRSVDWIRKNGQCLDNIVPKPSTNPRAGRGAFAQRFIAKGDIVVPAPLLQITDRDALRIPAFNHDSGKWQLLLNYCLGHNDSSLLLCPNTNAILVNHCSNRNPETHPCSKQNSYGVNEPNAEYRWAEWDNKTKDWISMKIDDMKQEEGRGLSLEIVATRNILEGEEVFVDYGVSWEKAWEQHVFNWKPPHYENEEWTSIKELNEDLNPLPIAPNLFSSGKLDNRNALFTGCYYYEDHWSLWDSFQANEEWDFLASEEVVAKYAQDYGEFYAIGDQKTFADGDFWPCIVIGKGPDDETYTVRILQSKNHGNTIWTERKLPRIISNYPRSSIRHFYLPYKSDIHLPGVFRHHIELPDKLIPTHWKDRSDVTPVSEL